ncbi:MAG: arylsulfatase, partial [Bacteroidota bacterium]
KGLFKDPSARLELYDLNNDIAEEIDLSSAYPEVVMMLDSIMKTARIPSEVFPFEALDNN